MIQWRLKFQNISQHKREIILHLRSLDRIIIGPPYFATSRRMPSVYTDGRERAGVERGGKREPRSRDKQTEKWEAVKGSASEMAAGK